MKGSLNRINWGCFILFYTQTSLVYGLNTVYMHVVPAGNEQYIPYPSAANQLTKMLLKLHNEQKKRCLELMAALAPTTSLIV